MLRSVPQVGVPQVGAPESGVPEVGVPQDGAPPSEPPPAVALAFAGWRLAALQAALEARGVRRTRAAAAVGELARAYHKLGLPWPQVLAAAAKSLQPELAALCAPEPVLEITEQALAADGTRRLLLRLGDGEVIETVLLRSTTGVDRTTVCLSSQAGCARRCAFCETGRLGLRRSLTAAEIVLQFRTVHHLWQGLRGALPPLTNVVFMGMGEPLDNLDAVADACAVLQDDRAYGLSWRRMTVSTVGVASQIPAFFQEVRAHLAVSLNAPDDARRSRLMPINRATGLAELKAALLAALPPGRDVLVEYVLFGGFNDALGDADLLRAWLQGLPVRLNLIPANPGPDPSLRTPDSLQVRAFQQRLLDAGVRAMVRWPHGREVGGACGQLAGARRGRVSAAIGPVAT